MYRLLSDIKIGAWKFSQFSSLTITSDSETLTDTCRLELPRKIKWEGVALGAGSTPQIKRGDKVIVKIGYDDQLTCRFVGYVKNVLLGTPIIIECEDEMFTLKMIQTLKKSYREATIAAVLGDMLPVGIQKEIENVTIGFHRVTGDTVAQELEALQSKGIRSFFKLRDGVPVFMSGVIFPPETGKVKSFKHGLNIVDSDLRFRRKEDVKIKIKAISIMPDNSRIDETAGDADGEIRTVYRYNVTRSELKSFALQELERLKYEGLQGSFKVIGSPAVDKLDIINVQDENGYTGNYSVKKVTVSASSTDGMKQVIELGNIVLP